MAAGYQLAQALASTYQQLFKQKVRDWHLLRLYVQGECPGALVEVLGDVPPSAPEPAYQQFLDPDTQLVRVAKPSEFVGRRRTLQRCLKAIRTSLGVLIHGLGGVGKSTVTARLLERMVGYHRLVNFRQLDEDKLLKTLAEQCTSERGHEILNGKLPLMQRLTKFFTEGLNAKEQRFAFVLDDFEANLDLRNGVYVLQTKVVDVLLALLKAIQNSQLPHKVIITCRYNFTLSELNHRLYREPLGALGGADLIKKYNRLDSFNGSWQFQPDLPERAKKAADGNPRLLEWLDKILQNSPKSPSAERGVEMILQKMADKEKEFREDILAQVLLKQQSPGLRQMLGKLLVYELPVPQAAIDPICEDISSCESHIQRAEFLGLLEVTLTNNKKRLYRVPRILSPLLEFPENPKGEELYKQAAQILYRVWWEAESSTEAQKLEIHRLALLAKDGEIAVNVANYVSRIWIPRSRFRETNEICQKTLKIIRNYRILSNLARVENEIGKVDQAVEHYQEALNICPDNDIIEICGIKHCLAYIKSKSGELDLALEMYQECLIKSESISNLKGKASALHEIARIYNLQGKVDDALAICQECLTIQESVNDIKGQASILHQIAYIKAQQGKRQEALTSYEKSFHLKEKIGDLKGKVSTLHQIASIKEDQGDFEAVFNILQLSLQIVEQIGSVELKAALFYNIASTHLKLGQFDSAINFMNSSIKLAQEIHDIEGQARALHQLGVVYEQQGKFENALKFYGKSLNFSDQIGYLKGQAHTLHQMANIYVNQRKINDALVTYKKALEIEEHIQDIRGKASTLASLGQMLVYELGDYEQGLDYLRQSLSILQHLQSCEADTVRQIIFSIQNSNI
ncbi:TPR repeat-containing protein [Nostoc sp. NIES-2111]|nr:TPR repeat-containing protein [Nostoc sp. NIES-2111]